MMVFSGWEAGNLLGLAPLFLTSDADSRRTLHFLGSEEISDYLDFIAKPHDMQLFIHSLLAYLNQNDVEKIDGLSLVNIPQDSPALNALETGAEELGWSVQIEKAYHTPVIKLAENWDNYLSGIDKKQRHEIRRKLRRVEDEAGRIAWYYVKDRQNLQNEIEAFFKLMELDDQKKEFLSPVMQEQMYAILSWAFDEGFLQLSFLEINGEKAAVYCCFDYKNRVYVYNSGFNIAFSSFSPGWVLLSYLIQHAILNKKSHFDFMRGDEAYKYRFGAVDSFVMRAILNRNTA